MTNEDDDDDASDESSLTSVIEVIVKVVVSVSPMKLRYLPVLDSLCCTCPFRSFGCPLGMASIRSYWFTQANEDVEHFLAPTMSAINNWVEPRALTSGCIPQIRYI